MNCLFCYVNSNNILTSIEYIDQFLPSYFKNMLDNHVGEPIDKVIDIDLSIIDGIVDLEYQKFEYHILSGKMIMVRLFAYQVIVIAVLCMKMQWINLCRG